jgi:Glycosyltransferase family 87
MPSAAARVARIVVPAIAIGLLAAVQLQYFDRGLIPGDAFTYLAAGERLNAGHALYALAPGDRPVGLSPPFWTVPLLSPPPIAVLFRPLALFSDAGAYIWWGICLTVIAISLLALLRRRPIAVGLAMVVLTIPLVYEIGVGNLNAVVVGGLLLTWRLLAARRDLAAGIALAGVTVLKLTPGIFAWWVISQRRWGVLRSFVIAGVVFALISLVGAGLSAHLDYLSIVGQTATTGTSNLSLAGLARTAGLPSDVAAVLPYIALVVGLALIWLLRDRPAGSWAIAVGTMLAASPVVNINWFTLFLAALAPLAWPMPADAAEPIGPGPFSSDYRAGASRMDPSASS